MFKAKITARLENKILLDIDFEFEKSLAIVGQSGSGKSLTLKSLLNLTPNSMSVVLEYDSSFKLENGKSVALVPQNPFTALSPKSKIKSNFLCDILLAKKLFTDVGLDSELLNKYPNELSGGQLQRVCIAIALSHSPKLLLLDEPTTALDGHTKHDICNLICKLQDEFGFLIIFVSHEIDLAKIVCQDVIVLENGRICEKNKFCDFIKEQTSIAGKNLIQSGFKSRAFRK